MISEAYGNKEDSCPKRFIDMYFESVDVMTEGTTHSRSKWLPKRPLEAPLITPVGGPSR